MIINTITFRILYDFPCMHIYNYISIISGINRYSLNDLRQGGGFLW